MNQPLTLAEELAQAITETAKENAAAYWALGCCDQPQESYVANCWPHHVPKRERFVLWRAKLLNNENEEI